jgi:hypothetical protein
MSSSSAGILAALRKAHEDRVKEPNAVITVAKKLLRAIEDVKNNPENNLEKMIAKPIITKLHSFSIQAMLAKEGPVSLPGPNLPDTASWIVTPTELKNGVAIGCVVHQRRNR